MSDKSEPLTDADLGAIEARAIEAQEANVARPIAGDEIRQARAAAGMCVLCGRGPGWNGTRRCEDCRAKRAGKAVT